MTLTRITKGATEWMTNCPLTTVNGPMSFLVLGEKYWEDCRRWKEQRERGRRRDIMLGDVSFILARFARSTRRF